MLEDHADLAAHGSDVTGIVRDKSAVTIAPNSEEFALDLDRAVVRPLEGHHEA